MFRLRARGDNNYIIYVVEVNHLAHVVSMQRGPGAGSACTALAQQHYGQLDISHQP